MSEAAVLLVDDDAPIRRMLTRTLTAEGYAVAAVGDGGAALAEVERSVPDVIVLDVAMPGMDGLDVTRRLRAKGLPVPILLLTARDALQERVAGLDAGADDYLVKPFEVEELTARVRALLRRNHPPGEQLAFADLMLEPESGLARRGGRELRLTRRGRLAMFVSTVLMLGVLGVILGSTTVATDEPGAPVPATMVVVEPGQTLWDLAAKANPNGDIRTTVDDIMRLNSIESAGAMQAGDTIAVPLYK